VLERRRQGHPLKGRPSDSGSFSWRATARL
jgi:hypothetical protein